MALSITGIGGAASPEVMRSLSPTATVEWVRAGELEGGEGAAVMERRCARVGVWCGAKDGITCGGPTNETKLFSGGDQSRDGRPRKRTAAGVRGDAQKRKRARGSDEIKNTWVAALPAVDRRGAVTQVRDLPSSKPEASLGSERCR